MRTACIAGRSGNSNHPLTFQDLVAAAAEVSESDVAPLVQSMFAQGLVHFIQGDHSHSSCIELEMTALDEAGPRRAALRKPQRQRPPLRRSWNEVLPAGRLT